MAGAKNPIEELIQEAMVRRSKYEAAIAVIDDLLRVARAYAGLEEIHGPDRPSEAPSVSRQEDRRKPTQEVVEPIQGALLPGEHISARGAPNRAGQHGGRRPQGTIAVRKAIIEVLRNAQGRPVPARELLDGVRALGAVTKGANPESLIDLHARNAMLREKAPIERLGKRTWRWIGPLDWQPADTRRDQPSPAPLPEP